ncbi:MAG: FapA family protein [bacterium]|nr:FapA family protein [bacterium]
MTVSVAEEALSVLIEAKAYTSNLDSEIIIEFSEDKSVCFLTITFPKLSGRIPTFSDVISFIEKKGVLNIDQPLIKKVLEKHLFDKKFTVAKGRLSTKGESAKYLYRFTEDTDVISGQLLAVKKLATYGEAGLTAAGEEIPAILGDNFQMIAGKNTVISRDRTRLFAISPGKAFWKENRCDVEPLLIKEGSLTEDIDFSGAVEIRGSARDVKIRSVGDIKITGDANSCIIRTEGTLTVEGALSGCDAQAKGDMMANSVEAGRLSAGGSIIARTGMIDVESQAKYIFVIGKKGIIMTRGAPPPALFNLPIAMAKGITGLSGGKAYAEKGVDAEVLGSIDQKTTEIKVGKGGKISCALSIYPKAKLIIGLKSYEAIKPEESLTFFEERGKIVSKPYEQAEVELTEPIYGPAKLLDPPSVVIPSSNLSDALDDATMLLGLSKEQMGEFEIGSGVHIFFPKTEKGPWIRVIEETKRRKEEEEKRPGDFKIQNLPEGLYLSCFAPGEKGTMPPLAFLAESLKGYKRLNIPEIKRAYAERKGLPIKIAERQYIEDLDGKIIVEIRDNEGIKSAYAYLTLSPKKPDGIFPPIENILGFIKEIGVNRPIDLKKVRLALKKSYHKPFLICQYQPPTKGESASYAYQYKEPYDVIPGQILAIKQPPKLGEDGINVKGEPIRGILGNDFSLSEGMNTSLSSDGRRLYAVDSGRITWTTHRADVEKVLEIQGDLLEDIEFSGKIIVFGSVKPKVKLVAGGSVAIKKDIAPSAEISSGGNIEIDADVCGTEKQKIFLSAKGDIVVNSISFSEISAGGAIVLRTGMLDCQAKCRSISVTGRRGIIMTKGTPPPPLFQIPIAMTKGIKGIVGGGRIEAIEFIDCEQIGSVEHKMTEVKIGEEGKISVSEAIYPKVRVSIGGKSMEIKEVIESATFKLKAGRIEKFPYEPSEVALVQALSEEKGQLEEPPSIFLPEETSSGYAADLLEILENEASSLAINNGLLFFPKDRKGHWLALSEEIKRKEEEEERRKGSFEVKNTPEGLYIQVYPGGKMGEPVAYDEVAKELGGFINLDLSAVRDAVERRDSSLVRVAPRQYIPELDSSLSITVRDRGDLKSYEAVLTIGEPRVGGMLPSVKSILSFLNKEGIKYGVFEKKIRIALKKAYYKPFIVAEGKMPSIGKPARYLYQLTEDIEVIPGQILAIRESPSFGEPGIDCLGQEILGLLGDDLPIVAGRNTYLDQNILSSASYGRPKWNEARCDIEKTMEISGDLTEDLEFEGRVIVKGSVKKAVKVSCENIEVEGDVEEGGSIIAKETVTVSGHIVGTETEPCVIKVGADIIAESAAYSVLTAEGVIVMSTGMRCSASAKRLYIVGKKGVIMSKKAPERPKTKIPIVIERGIKGLVGGEISAEEVFADIIGSPSFEPTEIKIANGGVISAATIYPKTKIDFAGQVQEITSIQGKVSFCKEQGKIVTGPFKEAEVKLTEVVSNPQRTDYPPSILLPSGSKKRAGELLGIEEGSVDSLPQKDSFLYFQKGKVGPWTEILQKISEEKKREEERPGDFTIQSLPEGLFITVTPPGARGAPLDLAKIMEAVEPYSNVDVEKVKTILEKKEGRALRIAPRQYLPDIDSKVEIEVR